MRPLAHSIEAVGAVAVTPVLALVALLRPSLRRELPERLGWVTSPGSDRIWLHASSVGEAKAACRLLDALEASGHSTRATAMTVSGRGIFHRDRPTMPATLAPLDHPWCIEAAMRGGRPRLSVLIETELWPSWIAACARHGVPVVVVSGRLSDRSFPRYRRIRRLIAPTLRRLDAVGARTELDAARFAELGVPDARIRVTGDLKLDPPTEPPVLGRDLARALGGRIVVTGGSTHRGEEDPLLAALDVAEAQARGFVLVLAPRDVGRAGEVVRLALARGRRAVLRSRLAGESLRPGEVLVLDSYGELAAAYAASTLAFVGGTLVAVGGHNVSEPVHAGCPVLFGPEIANVRKIVEILEADGSGRRVASSETLVAAIAASLRDPEDCRRRGEAGRRMLERHRGSVERSRQLILDVLAERAMRMRGTERRA